VEEHGRGRGPDHAHARSAHRRNVQILPRDGTHTLHEVPIVNDALLAHTIVVALLPLILAVGGTVRILGQGQGAVLAVL